MNEVIKACNSDVVRYKEYIVIDGNKIEIRGELFQSAYKNTHFIGTFNLSYMKFTTENNIDYKKKEFDYFKVVNGLPIKIGHFYVTEVKISDTFEEVSVIAYDNGLKFANHYVTDLDYKSGNVTLFQVAQEICQKAGVKLKNTSITNGNFIVDSNQFPNAKFGDVISAVAYMSCNFAIINENGELEFIFNTPTDDIIEDYVELDDKRDTRPITSVSLGMENVEGENVVMKDQSLIDKYGEHWLIINDCPFAYTEEKRRQLITAIFNKVKGFSYSSFVSKYAFKPYMKLGNLIKFKNKKGELINSIVLKIETKYDEVILSAPSITDSKVKYENPLSLEQRVKNAEFKVDKEINQIKGTVESIEEEVIPTAKISGSDINIKDGAEAPFIDFSVDGKSYQETRESYNLCPNNFQSQKVSGVDFVRNEDGTITANGTSTAIIESEIIICENQKFPKGKIFISGTPTGGGTNFTYGIKYNINNSSSTKTIRALGNLIENTSENNLWKITAFVFGGKQVNNILFKPMVTLEKDKNKPYISYGNIPNPEHPSEIKSVGYTNLFNISKVTNHSDEFGSISIKENKIIIDSDLKGRGIHSGKKLREVSDLKVGDSYYINFDSTGYNKYIYLEGANYTWRNGTKLFITQKILDSEILFYGLDNHELAEITNFIISKKPHPYIPYGKYGLDVTNMGKNLIDKNTVVPGLVNDSNGNMSTSTPEQTDNRRTDYIEVDSDTDYFMSNIQGSSRWGAWYDKDKKFIKGIAGYGNLHSPINAKYVAFTLKRDYLDQIIFCLGKEQPYEPYKKIITQIVLPEQLKSIDEKDKLVRKNGIWGIETKIGKELVDLSQLRVFSYNNIDYASLKKNTNSANYGNYKAIKILSNKATFQATDGDWDNANKVDKLFSTPSETMYWIGFKKGTTLEEMKTKLKDLEVVYNLKEPQFIPLEESEQEKLNKLSTFKGTNNITTTDELEPNLNLEYVRDTKVGNFVNGQVDNVKTTTEKKIAELIVKDDEISAEVKNVSSVSQNNYQELNTKFDGYTPKSDTAELEKSVKQIQTDTYTKTEINTKLIDGSVTKVQTISGTFDENGMHYEKTNAPTKSTINERGVSVDDSISDRELLFAGYDDTIKQTIVRTENLTVRKYLVVGDHTRIEKYGNGGGLFTL